MQSYWDDSNINVEADARVIGVCQWDDDRQITSSSGKIFKIELALLPSIKELGAWRA